MTRWIPCAALLAGCSLVISDLDPPENDAAVLDAVVIDAIPDAGSPPDARSPSDAAPAPDQALPIDAAPPPDAQPDMGECVDGLFDQLMCGINNRGVRSRLCEGGRWGQFGACVDPDECVDGSEDHAVCGLNERGVRVSACVDGHWGPPGECDDPDECVDGAEEVEACPDAFAERQRACFGGQWTPWGMCLVCLPGIEEARTCGFNGRGAQMRTCLGPQGWSDWSECDDPDECVDGRQETERCGPRQLGERRRICVEGAWGAFDECDR